MLARATGRAPFATVDGLRMARYTMHFDDSKARRELGYTSRPYREGLVEAIEWFIQAGYMKRAAHDAVARLERGLAAARAGTGRTRRPRAGGASSSAASAPSR